MGGTRRLEERLADLEDLDRAAGKLRADFALGDIGGDGAGMLMSAGEPAKLIGFPTPFGMAPPDFEARTLVDFPRLPAMLAVNWGANGTTAPFSSQEPTGLVLNLANPDIGRLHAITIGPRVIDVTKLPASPRIVSPKDGPTAYLIVARDGSQSFSGFADFVNELNTRLDGTTAVIGLTASGSYDGDANVLAARSMVLVLK